MKISITQSNKNRLIGIFIWLILWEILYLIINKDIYLPSPFHVLNSIITIIMKKDFILIILNTTYRVIISFAISAILGIIIGFFCGINNQIYEIFEPFIILIRSTPLISIIIIAIIWFKSTYVPVFSGFLICFPLIWTNMVQGIRSTDDKLIEMSKIYKLSSWQLFKFVYLPSAFPFIKSGFSNALGLAWKVVAAAEVLSLPKYAIGSKLHDTKVYLEIPDLLAWTLIIILLSYIFEILFTKLFAYFKKYELR